MMAATINWPGNRAIRLWQADGRYLAAVEGLNIHGCGNNAAEAVETLLARYAEASAFADRLRLPLDSMLIGGRIATSLGLGERLKSILATMLAVVVVVSVSMIPLSYALSTGLERGAKRIERMVAFPGKTGWDRIENALVKGEATHFGLAPGQGERIGKALQSFAQDTRPMASGINAILAGHDEVSKPR